MKSAITGILTIAMLTASISGFAISDNATAADKNSNTKSEKAATTCTAEQANCCEQARTREAEEQAAREKQIERENQEWLAALMYNR